jgi:putative sigma-54 modulation protein
VARSDPYMRLELTGRHVDITPGIRRIIDGKLARLERMLNDSAVSAQVVLTREKTGSRADVTLHTRGEKFLHGNGRGASAAVAMSEAVDKLVQQAHKVKSKWQERKRRTGKAAPRAESPETPASSPAAAAPPSGRARVRMPRILRASRQAIRIMSVSDAARQIDGGEGAIVFRDAETSRIAVLYRAAGGDLTLIETEGLP